MVQNPITSNQIAQDEHEANTEPKTKRVLVYGWDGTQKVRLNTDNDGNVKIDASINFPFEDYQYMGSQTIGSYKYLGFKEYADTNWMIMRKDTTTGLFQYDYGSSGWSTIWAAPDTGSYGDPPDS